MPAVAPKVGLDYSTSEPSGDDEEAQKLLLRQQALQQMSQGTMSPSPSPMSGPTGALMPQQPMAQEAPTTLNDAVGGGFNKPGMYQQLMNLLGYGQRPVAEQPSARRQ